MRVIYLVILVAFVAVIGIFAYLNKEPVYLDLLVYKEDRATMAMVAGAFYFLGMFSGWAVVGMLRRSFHGITQAQSNSGYRS